MKLLSLYANNFKKLRLKQPLCFTEGIILITGLNESGKSTILDAILYALFGRMIRPSQKPGNDEIISYGASDCKVKLEFAIGPNKYRVTREVHRTRHGRALLQELRPDSTTRNLATSFSETTDEVERLLGGITYNEIVASSVVAQKDLERLIKQRLDDRRKVINVFLNLESFNKVQDQLDTERNGIEGTSRTPGHLTLERERLETLNEQLNEYKDTSVQLDNLNVKVEKLKKDQQHLEKRFVDTDNRYKTLNEYGEAVKQRDSLQREIEDKSLLTNNLQQQLASDDAQRAELSKAEAEVKKYVDLAEAEKAITRASEVLEKVRSAELQKAQFEEREQRLRGQIAETNKNVTSADESQIASSTKPRRIWSYLLSTAAFGAGAILSFILAFAALSIVLGSLAVVSLLLLTRQIVSLSQQADASKQQQERLASAQLVASWGNELEEVKKDRDTAEVTIRQGSNQILQVLSAIPSYSSYLEGLNDPREVVEQASLIYNQDKQSLSAVTERVNMLQKRLGEEPLLKRQLAQAHLDIATVERKHKNTLLPSLPEGVEFSPELLDEASQMRDSLNESVSRVKTQIEESMTRIIELKQFLEENKGLEEQVDEQKRKVLLLQKQLAVVKYSIKGLEQTSESLRNRVKPQVERYMSQILPVITSGRYKAVQLEDDYTVRVFDPEAGEFRPKEVFSGGTEDQLLLAMRLAFALALIPQAKGRNPEFLFLDEPLGSSDKVRREGILALMHGELSQNFKQIFLISHVGDLEVEADTVIEMENGAVREVVTRKSSLPQPIEIPA